MFFKSEVLYDSISNKFTSDSFQFGNQIKDTFSFQCFQVIKSLKNCISRVEIANYKNFCRELVTKTYLIIYERNRSWRSHLSNGERERQSSSTRKRKGKKKKKTRTTFCLFLNSGTFSTRHEGIAFGRNYVPSFIRSYGNTSSSSMIRSLRRPISFITQSFISITVDDHVADCTIWDVVEVSQLWNHRGGHMTSTLYRRAESCWRISTRNDSVQDKCPFYCIQRL